MAYLKSLVKTAASTFARQHKRTTLASNYFLFLSWEVRRMSKDRFPYFPARARHFNSPLAEERHRFLAHLVQQGYVRLSVENAARYLLTITKSLRLDKRPGVLIRHAEIESHASRWAHRQNRPKWSRQKNPDIVFARFRCFAIQWLGFLGRLRPVQLTPKPFAAEIAAFVQPYALRARSVANRPSVATDGLHKSSCVGSNESVAIFLT